MSPYELVAQALNCTAETLSGDSGLHTHPEWDSFGHLNVVLALERELRISIEDEQILALSDMKKISSFWEQRSKEENH